MPAQNAPGQEPFHVSRLIVTVEVDSGPVSKTYTESHLFAIDLLKVFESQNVVATWALRDVRGSELISALIRSDSTQELAVLGDETWIGPTVPRKHFQATLAKRVAEARATGLPVRCLAPTVAGASAHCDLLLREEIGGIAGIGRQPSHFRRFSTPRKLHWGLWELPVAARFPDSGWLANRLAWRRLKQAVAEDATFHLVIDVGELAKNRSNWALRNLERLGDLRNRGLVLIETLGSLTERLCATCSQQRQRSILRQAA